MNSPTSSSSNKSTIRLTLVGLIALSVCLVVASAFLTHLLEHHTAPVTTAATPTSTGIPASETAPPPAGQIPPWGELLTLDVELEQPEEYVAFEATTDRSTTWVFTGNTLAQTRSILTQCGMPPAQLEAALAPAMVEVTSEATTVKPSDEVVLALTPEVRAKLYVTLAQWPANPHMANPYHLTNANFGVLSVDSDVPAASIAMVKNLTYTQRGNQFFSDPDVVLHKIPSPEGRLHLLKMLTYQTAVLARLRLRPDSDLDKILGYWGTVPGVHAKDLRPLLESIKNTPDGGTLSLLYFLPAFARERLYTSPLPFQAGDVKMDCHWSAMNFFNATPDPRFQDNAYASAYIKDHCYQIGKPSMCGDLVFLMNSKGQVIHSAVYIADDLVFTKNGINFAQPWILMRIPNLRGVFTFSEEPQIVYYRRKEA
ncbi:MAG: hypothetical protein WCK77_14025 [Verrucomicrobiota bacterium]